MARSPTGLKAPTTRSTSSARILETGLSDLDNYKVAWGEVSPLVSQLVVNAQQVIQDMVLHATLDLSGWFYQFEPSLFDILYDTAEEPPARDTLCLPILRFINPKVHPVRRSPRVYGLLVVPVATPVAAAKGRKGEEGDEPEKDERGGSPDCHRRVGYFSYIYR